VLIVVLASLVLLPAAVFFLRDPDRITLSANPDAIDWDATVRQVVAGKFGLVRGRGPYDPDRFLDYGTRRPGILMVDSRARGSSGGTLLRIGDRHELTSRFGEGFETRFEKRGTGLGCGGALLGGPSGSPVTGAVVPRPRQFYFVERTYGPGSTKSGRTELAVVEVLEHDVVRRVLTLRRYPVR